MEVWNRPSHHLDEMLRTFSEGLPSKKAAEHKTQRKLEWSFSGGFVRFASTSSSGLTGVSCLGREVPWHWGRGAVGRGYPPLLTVSRGGRRCVTQAGDGVGARGRVMRMLSGGRNGSSRILKFRQDAAGRRLD